MPVERKKIKICFTGGGTLGHVIPCLNLSKKLNLIKWEKFYICSEQKNEIERIKSSDQNIRYKAIKCEKLRRFATIKHMLIPIKIFFGVMQSLIFLFKNKIDVVFSTGGYVSFPVIISAWILRKKIISYELDISQSLSSKMTTRFASIILTNFPALEKKLIKNNKINNKKKIKCIGYIYDNDINSTLDLKIKKFFKDKDFNFNKKIVLVFGGSAGSKTINEYLYNFLDKILEDYSVIHFYGKNNSKYSDQKDYLAIEYADKNFLDFIKLSSIVICRAGANTISELSILKKPNILIPLSKKISRGEQLENALYMQSVGASEVILEEKLFETDLKQLIKSVLSKEQAFIKNMELLTSKQKSKNSIEKLLKNIVFEN